MHTVSLFLVMLGMKGKISSLGREWKQILPTHPASHEMGFQRYFHTCKHFGRIKSSTAFL